MAEQGIEKTPKEAAEIFNLSREVFDDVDYETYLYYKSFDDNDIVLMAESQGHTFQECKDVVEMLVYIGELKYKA